MRVVLAIQDKASPALMALLRGTEGRDYLAAGARGVFNLCRTHFDRLQAERPNQLGGRRTNFWRSVKGSMQAPILTPNTATIRINHVGFAQRLRGGEIRAGRSTNPRTGAPTRFLAIPLRSEAYGVRPAERDDLDFIPSRRRGQGGILVESRQTTLKRVRRKDGVRFKPTGEVGGLALYALVTRVRQAADPSVLPGAPEMGRAAGSAMEQLLAMRVARQTGGRA